MWSSSKLLRVRPEWRPEFTWLLPAALANGVFEADPHRLWQQCYAFNRPGVFPDTVAAILDEFEKVKLLFRWEHCGKQWGYWVGIEKEGRLPSASRGKHGKWGPEVPKDKLKEFLDNQRLTNGQAGFGFGSGSGNGFGLGGGGGTAATTSTENPHMDAQRRSTLDTSQTLAYQGHYLKITQEQHEKLQSGYQSLSVAAHYPTMDLYLDSHSGEAKGRRKNHYAFARNWLARELRQRESSTDTRHTAQTGSGPQLGPSSSFYAQVVSGRAKPHPSILRMAREWLSDKLGLAAMPQEHKRAIERFVQECEAAYVHSAKA